MRADFGATAEPWAKNSSFPLLIRFVFPLLIRRRAITLAQKNKTLRNGVCETPFLSIVCSETNFETAASGEKQHRKC